MTPYYGKATKGLCSLVLLLTAVFICSSKVSATEVELESIRSQAVASFGDGAYAGEVDQETATQPVYVDKDVVGYLFQTDDHVEIPAYSGKPVNLLVAIDLKGTYRFAWVLEHHEPILLVGIPESKLNDFASHYVGHSIDDKIRVGSSAEADTVNIDAVTGATVTVMVVNETILRAAREAAIKVGIAKPTADDLIPPSKVKLEQFQTADWLTLNGDGSIRRLLLSQAQVDQEFEAIGVEQSIYEAVSGNNTFIDLYYTYLNAPTIGRNLLGEREYSWLMEKLQPGEHAVALMANGEYSFRGNGFVRGGIFDRISVSQNNQDISFRDLDYFRLNDIYPEGHPRFQEMAIFIIREHYRFDPGKNWSLNLLVRRQTGPIESVFVNMSGGYQTPERYITRPTAEEIEAAKPPPLWVSVWKNKAFQISVLLVSLIFLTTIIFLQNWLVQYPKFFHTVRRGFLVYTLFFVGWYCLGQISVVNVLTFSQALFGDFRWELFLMDPVIFIIWVFTAGTIILWGRGIFCGWLCPFGAFQELINEISRKLKVKQWEPKWDVHERLWALKYIIFLGLFGVSLESMSTAEKLAEVEPFKTSILMFFQREWWFVTYAVILLVVSIFTRKVYCRYICPLGAALAIPSKLRLFDWLKRRKECGQPCQLCAKECEIQAILPDGKIMENECHHCLDCQVTYNNEDKCPPLVIAKRKGKKRITKLTEDDLIEIKNVAG